MAERVSLDNNLARFILRALPSSDFSAESATERILSLQDSDNFCGSVQAVVSAGCDDHAAAGLDVLEGATPVESRSMKLLRYGSIINLDSLVSVESLCRDCVAFIDTMQINCSGAVLADLHRRRSTGFLPDGQSAEAVFRVGSLQMFSLSDYMFISAEDMLSLQFLQSETHPNSQMSGSGSTSSSSKESLSIYGLFHLLACTPQGRTHLRQMFLRPTTSLDIISERQQAISLLLRPDNCNKLKEITVILHKIRNVRHIMAQLRKGVDSPSAGRSFDRGVWATLRRFAAQCLRLREVVTTFGGSGGIAVIRRVIDKLSHAWSHEFTDRNFS